MKSTKKRKKLKRARVSFVSLVPKGANHLPGLYKAEDDQLEVKTLCLEQEEGKFLSLVYVPDRDDTQGHYASKEVIQQMADSFMEEGAKLDLRHDRRELKREQAYVTQSFIVQPGDPRFVDARDYSGNSVDATGGWAMEINIVDPELRKLYREEQWSGVSLFAYNGDYDFETPVDVALEDFTQRKLQMTPEEIQGLLKSFEENMTAKMAEMVEGLSKTEAVEEEQVKAEEKAVDLNDLDALRQRQRQLQLEELQGQFDLSTSEGIAGYLDAVEKMDSPQEEEESKEESIEKEEDTTVEELQSQLVKLESEIKRRNSASNIGEGIAKEEESPILGLSKEDAEAYRIGLEMAEMSNARRGY